MVKVKWCFSASRLDLGTSGLGDLDPDCEGEGEGEMVFLRQSLGSQ